MLIVVGIVQLFISGLISDQQDRNNLIVVQIAKLDKQIKEINELQAQKDALLARMNIIQSLQGTRPLVVHLFDDLVRALPDGAYTSSIVQSGNKLVIEGFAQSNARVSAFMRNIDKSEWLTEPTLNVIRAADSKHGKTSQFTLRAKQASTLTDEEKEAAKSAGRKRPRKR
jgi:type IV pilus assembly protein PilN